MFHKLLFILLFVPLSAFAQTFSGQSGDTIRVVPPFRSCLGPDNGTDACFIQGGTGIARLDSGKLDFQMRNATVAALPTAALNSGRIYVVTDASTAGSCTVGGGTALALCRSSGAVWQSIGDGVGGGGGGNINPGTAVSQIPNWNTGSSLWVPQAKAIYDTRDWATCDGVTDATAGMAALVNAIGTQNATIRVIGTTTASAACVVKFAHFSSNISLDFSGGGALQLLSVVTAPGGGAFVQGSGQANNPSSSTCSATLNGTVAGNAVVMMVSLYNTFGNSRILNITDGKNFYIQQQQTTLGQAGYEALYVAPSISGGNVTVTANFSGTATKNACIAWEISGLGPVPKIDAGTFSYGSTTPFNSGAATLAAGDLVIGYSEDPNGAQTCTAGAGYTQPASTAGNVSSAGPSMCAEYIASGAGGSTTATQNFSSSPVASSYVSAIVGLKPGIATVIPQGGILNPDGHQIFINATGTNGVVDFTGNLASFEIHPEWWGASNNANAATNTPALQASIIAAFGCGVTTCRVNGSGLGIYNKTLRLTGQYQINDELQMYHVIGQAGSRAKIACDGGGIIQTVANKRIFDGQSDAYLVLDNCSWTGNASSTNALIDWDYNGSQGNDLRPQFIDHKENFFNGNSQVDVGVLIAKSGGGAQGSNIYCHNCESTGFTGAAWQIGGDNTGRNVGRLSAPNALAIGYDGDIQGCPLYGIAVYGGGYVSFGGGPRLSTMENGFATQTGYDFYGNTTQGPLVMEHVRSESRKLIFCNTCQLKDVFAINQATFPIPGTTQPVGTIMRGGNIGGDGAYYKVTVDSSAFIGFGSQGAAVVASGGSATTLADTNQTITGSTTIKTFTIGETVTQAVTGSTGTLINKPLSTTSVTGSVTSGTITLGETMTQAVTGITATEQAPTPTGSATLFITNLSGTADNTHDWVGGTSGAHYTPNAAPVFAPASPSMLISAATGSPDNTNNWTGGTSAAVYVPTSAPTGVGWTVNAFTGMLADVAGGTNQFCYGVITSNTANTITLSAGWLTKYPQVTCSAPNSTSTFYLEPNWNHGTVVDGGITMVYMNENVIDGINGAFGTFEDVIAYGGQWHMGNSASQRTVIRHGQVSRSDWYNPQTSTPHGAPQSEGTVVDGDWEVIAILPGGDRPISWQNLTVGAGTSLLDSLHQNLSIRRLCWNAGTSSQSANEVCIGGRNDPNSSNDATRAILQIHGMLGRGAPTPTAANSYSITDQAGTDTDFTGGPSTGTGAGGAINFWTSNPSGSSATVNSGLKRWLVSAAGHFLTGLDNTYDIGANGATRPRTVYAGTSVVAPNIILSGLAPATLTDGATISWNVAGWSLQNATVTLGGNRTLNVSNLVSGGNYTLRIVQDATPPRTLTLGTGCTWKVSGGGAGAITLTNGANAIDVLSFYYDGSVCYAVVGNNFN